MHIQAYEYVQKQVARRSFNYVVEFGSLDINGSVRELFKTQKYHGIDFQAGAIVCCEVLEHTPSGHSIVNSAYRNLVAGGLFIVTCATDPRAPHSAVDGGWLREGEYYENVDPETFQLWCQDKFDIENIEVIRKRGDLYATMRKI